MQSGATRREIRCIRGPKEAKRLPADSLQTIRVAFADKADTIPLL